MSDAASRAKPRSRVLGVEPDPVTRALIALYLEPYGYEVRLVASVAEATRLLPDAGASVFVCSEWALGQVSPDERAGLRAGIGDLPVLALVEPGMPPSWTRDWPGVRERLTKPVRAEALLSVLESCRGAASAVAPPPRQAGQDEAIGGFVRFVRHTDLDAALVRDLIGSFRERAPGYFDEIGAGLAAGDLVRVDRASHALKGMVGNLHLTPLVELSDRLRLAAKVSDTDRALATLEALRSAYEEVSAALRQQWPDGGQ